jgi:RNA recognition motif-containing protein
VCCLYVYLAFAKRKEPIFVMGKRLYVGSLSYYTTEQALEDFFAQVGQVESVRIVTDRDTGRAKGFGFVEMVNEEDAQRAITTLNNAELDGRTLVVNEAKPQERREGGGGYGGGRGGYGGGNRGGGGGGYGGGNRGGGGYNDRGGYGGGRGR